MGGRRETSDAEGTKPAGKCPRRISGILPGRPQGMATPMGRVQDTNEARPPASEGRGAGVRLGWRTCLRKGCGRRYRARQWNQRYCQDPECLRLVHRWQATKRQRQRRATPEASFGVLRPGEEASCLAVGVGRLPGRRSGTCRSRSAVGGYGRGDGGRVFLARSSKRGSSGRSR